MKKLEWKFWLEVDQLTRLKAEALRQKVSVAHLIRKAIDAAFPQVTA